MNENQENNQEMNIPDIDSKYRKILIAAKRSKQLQKGARPRVTLTNAKPTRIALEELERGLVDFELTEKAER
jgi:DNA-directed RNA polymerase subunit omega